MPGATAWARPRRRRRERRGRPSERAHLAAAARLRPLDRPWLGAARVLHPLSSCGLRSAGRLPGPAAAVRGGRAGLSRGDPGYREPCGRPRAYRRRFRARAIADGGLPTEIVCIDPAPRADLKQLRVSHVPKLLAEVDPAILSGLEAGDVLFVDSSHIAMAGTDVDRLFLDVLPRLPAGVLLHVHDVFLPEGYPAEWAWRGYNEQLLVGALLQGGGYELLFASHYVATHRPYWLAGLADLPRPRRACETSLWLPQRRPG